MDYQIKKWNNTLQCWVLDTGNTVVPTKFWDAKLGKWVEDPSMQASPQSPQKSLTGQIAEIGAQGGKGRKIEEIPTPKEEDKKTYSAYTPYVVTRPWTGVDRNRFPNTFMALVKLYYAKDWYNVGPYISDDDYRDRVLKGIYKPQSKSVMQPNYGYGSYYYRGEEWE
jgi:hypothetical protein